MTVTTSSRSFRLVCTPEERPLVEELLRAQGYDFEPEPFSEWSRRITHEPKPLGSSLAAFFGLIYIQDRSSMLPPVVLNPDAGDAVLDMCASPGSKTGFLAQLVGADGFVMGNEPSRNRLATLRQNLFTMNLLHTATCSYPGESLPLPSGGWKKIQLDPPCSGWGTVERNPNVLKLWQGDKVKPLIGIQRKLLQEAFRLLAPGGKVVFSTCTTNVQENEEQVRFAVDEVGFQLEPVTPPEGFTFEAPYLDGCEGTLRVDPEKSGAQGFYIAAFTKPEDAEAPEEFEAGLKADIMPRKALSMPGVDAALLPDGELAHVRENALFLPQYALDNFPETFRWRGFPIGKMARGEVRPSPRLRALMPEYQEGNGINLEETEPIERLLTGQSMQVKAKGKETGLYFKGLRLGRLKVKGNRVLWSEK
ncbi:RsmB/NOP family class I SAM-dependent RNA methyltransferase [Halodesulfovibrio sp.]|uniref:RsmB/NOP family class I SAM-dependent RNA methyltransferase n=1 Tax=Halodesulfovibrio sp. TaxID=1912772 RepID=UPI00260118EA|nr:RsmB/NOP family class I SAM-dependent RNA methyltransferase [Halodesulfovibrio sp.]MCT4627667.1 RsmB/NOP family class I SAM-dependent RNA methyltransferase [Halodesulfovibrio sp.]